MSVQSEIDRINGNIADTYSVLSDMGAATPAEANSDNLASTAAGIAAVLYSKDQGLSYTQKEQARANIGALAETELDNAVNDALAQAKESGEFDGAAGKDGVSPTIAVSAITGGNRLTITDANGSRNVDVMNGKDGKDGADGSDGSPGATGPAGRGVQSMTYNSSTNKWTITYTDGTTSTVDGPAIPDASSYMPKSGGTFTGAVQTAAASTSGYYVRNIKFSDTAETPTTEGDICFKLK